MRGQELAQATEALHSPWKGNIYVHACIKTAVKKASWINMESASFRNGVEEI